MADKKLFDRSLVTAPASTKRIAIGTPDTLAENMTLASLKTWLGLTGTTATAILTKSVDIGSWNMDSSRGKNVSTGIALSKIRGIADIVIKSDSGEMFPAYYRRSNWELSLGAKVCNTPTNNAIVALERNDGAFFDAGGFNDTAINRGYIIVHYVA